MEYWIVGVLIMPRIKGIDKQIQYFPPVLLKRKKS